MTPVTHEELKTLRAALSALEELKDQAFNFRKDSVDKAVAYDIAHKRWWDASNNYTRKLNEFIEAGNVEGVRV